MEVCRPDPASRIRTALVESLSVPDTRPPSVAALCRRAGVGRSSFYRHFSSVDDVVDSVYRSMMSEIECEGSSRDVGRWGDYSGYMHRIFSIIHSHRSELLVLHRHGYTRRLTSALEGSFGIRDDTPLEELLTTGYHIGGIVRWVEIWLDRGMSDDPDGMAEMAMSVRTSVGRPVLMEDGPLRHRRGWMQPSLHPDVGWMLLVCRCSGLLYHENAPRDHVQERPSIVDAAGGPHGTRGSGGDVPPR